MENLVNLQDSKIIYGALLEARTCFTGRDQLRYMDIATEALSNDEARAVVMNNLYKSLSKLDKLDIEKIKNSKGNIIKFAYYDNLLSSIAVVKDLNLKENSDNIIMLEKINNLLLANTQDFVFGYKTNNKIIMSSYELLVMVVFEFVQYCAIDATASLRANINPKDNTTKTLNKDNSHLIKAVGDLMKDFENGNWNQMMTFFRRNYKELAVATEGQLLDNVNDIGALMKQAKTGIGDLKGTVIGKAIFSFAEKMPVKIALITIAALFSLRTLVFYFYRTAFDMNSAVKNNANILKVSINGGDSDDSSIAAQKKRLSLLEKVSDFITYKIFKAEKEVVKDIKEDNEATLAPEVIKTSSGTFEF